MCTTTQIGSIKQHIYVSLYTSTFSVQTLKFYIKFEPFPNIQLSCYLNKQTPWPLVVKRTIPTERPRNLVPTFADRGVSRGQRGGPPTVVNLSFLDRSSYLWLMNFWSSLKYTNPLLRNVPEVRVDHYSVSCVITIKDINYRALPRWTKVRL
jgi:hypothetical protein